MNVLDLLFGIPLLYALYKGFKKGFVVSFFTLLAFIVGVYMAIHFSDYTARILVEKYEVESAAITIIAFVLTFLLVGAGVFFLGKALEKVVQTLQLSALNKVGGSLFSGLKFAYIISCILLVLSSFAQETRLIPEKMEEESLLYKPLFQLSGFLTPRVQNSAIYVKGVVENDRSDKMRLQDLLQVKRVSDSLDLSPTNEAVYKLIKNEH